MVVVVVGVAVVVVVVVEVIGGATMKLYLCSLPLQC